MWTDREILMLTAVVTGIVALLTAFSTGNWAVTALTMPLVASAAFWSLQISRRIGFALQRRYDRSHAPVVREPIAPRPKHASAGPDDAKRRSQGSPPRGRLES